MTYSVYVRRAAELDVAEAQLWYEAQRDGLGAEFRSEISRIIDRLTETRSFTRSRIKMCEGRSFIDSRTSFGAEFLLGE